MNGFKRDQSTPSKEKRAKEPSIERTSHLVNANSGCGARLLNAMLTVSGLATDLGVERQINRMPFAGTYQCPIMIEVTQERDAAVRQQERLQEELKHMEERMNTTLKNHETLHKDLRFVQFALLENNMSPLCIIIAHKASLTFQRETTAND